MKKILTFVGSLSAFAVGSVSAAIVYSGADQNIPIPTSFAGVSITIDRTDASLTAAPDTSAGNTAGSLWDLNFFLGGAGIANTAKAQPVRNDGGDNLSFINNLVPTSISVDGTSIASGFGGSGFPNEHIGSGTEAANTAANMFTNSTAGYFGFVLDAETASPLYGWMKVTLDNTGSTGLINEWAFETTPSTPIVVGAIPEPSAFVLLFGVIGAALLRRQRK